MIDFSKLEKRNRTYGGANGSKICVLYKGELYMVKMPCVAKRNPNLSYSNSAISEYLGCHIFNMLGVKAQETLLGTYVYNNKQRVVVACKDFVQSGYALSDFASLKNQIIDSSSNGYGTDIGDILEAIQKQNILNPKDVINHFWDMFVIDALIANIDRHNGNWGFLYNFESDTMTIAPIFDCGSCLYPQIDEKTIVQTLNNQNEINVRIYDFPTSALMENNRRINYYDFLSSHKYSECDDAIRRIYQRIDLNEINRLIESVEFITTKHKEFLKIMIAQRFAVLIKNNVVEKRAD